MKNDLPDQSIVLDHPRIGQEFAQIDAHALRIGRVGRAEIDQQDTDARGRCLRGGTMGIEGNDGCHDP